jgi:hypothetical protein
LNGCKVVCKTKCNFMAKAVASTGASASHAIH